MVHHKCYQQFPGCNFLVDLTWNIWRFWVTLSSYSNIAIRDNHKNSSAILATFRRYHWKHCSGSFCTNRGLIRYFSRSCSLGQREMGKTLNQQEKKQVFQSNVSKNCFSSENDRIQNRKCSNFALASSSLHSDKFSLPVAESQEIINLVIFNRKSKLSTLQKNTFPN